MATFDQRGQQVHYQFNANGDINFGNLNSPELIAGELIKLSAEVEKATQAGVINKATAVEIKANIENAAIQVQKTLPDKKTVLTYLSEAKALIEGITAATGLVSALTQAAEIVRRLL